MERLLQQSDIALIYSQSRLRIFWWREKAFLCEDRTKSNSQSQLSVFVPCFVISHNHSAMQAQIFDLPIKAILSMGHFYHANVGHVCVCGMPSIKRPAVMATTALKQTLLSCSELRSDEPGTSKGVSACCNQGQTAAPRGLGRDVSGLFVLVLSSSFAGRYLLRATHSF